MKTKFCVGDRVKYSDAFVKSSGHSKEIADMRGKVVSVSEKLYGKNHLLKIQWHGETELKSALACNVAKCQPPTVPQVAPCPEEKTVYTLQHSQNVFANLTPDGICNGELVHVPSGIDAEKIGGTNKRPLCKITYLGRALFGWLYSEDMTLKEVVPQVATVPQAAPCPIRLRVFKKHKCETDFREVGAVFGDGISDGQRRGGLIWSALNQFNICKNEDYKLIDVPQAAPCPDPELQNSPLKN